MAYQWRACSLYQLILSQARQSQEEVPTHNHRLVILGRATPVLMYRFAYFSLLNRDSANNNSLVLANRVVRNDFFLLCVFAFSDRDVHANTTAAYADVRAVHSISESSPSRCYTHITSPNWMKNVVVCWFVACFLCCRASLPVRIGCFVSAEANKRYTDARGAAFR